MYRQCSLLCYKKSKKIPKLWIALCVSLASSALLNSFCCSTAVLHSCQVLPERKKKIYSTLVNVFSSSQNKVLHFLALVPKFKNSSYSDTSSNHNIGFWKQEKAGGEGRNQLCSQSVSPGHVLPPTLEVNPINSFCSLRSFPCWYSVLTP